MRGCDCRREMLLFNYTTTLVATVRPRLICFSSSISRSLYRDNIRKRKLRLLFWKMSLMRWRLPGRGGWRNLFCMWKCRWRHWSCSVGSRTTLDIMTDVDPSVHASVHWVSSQHFKSWQEFAEYCKSALLYLAYTSVETLTEDFKLVSVVLALEIVFSVDNWDVELSFCWWDVTCPFLMI